MKILTRKANAKERKLRDKYFADLMGDQAKTAYDKKYGFVQDPNGLRRYSDNKERQ